MSIPSDNPYLSDPDVLLMLEYQKGDKPSFEALMRKYYVRVFNFILRIVQRRDAAEDLTQEVFIKVYHAGSAYRPQAKFQTWVFTIAKNLALNELRRAGKTPVSLDAHFEYDGDEIPQQFEDKNSLSADEKLVQKETARMVKDAVQSLPESQRIAIILRRYEDFSYAEIAESLSCSVEAVKSLLSRAKETLKKRLAEYVKI